MENKKKLETQMRELFPIVEELVRSGKQVNLTVTGNSMYPMLRDRADSVMLIAPPEKLKRYDLPLYRREIGDYILHRILQIKNGVYTMCGDNQTALEEGIRREQIIAVAQEFYRNGRKISCSHPLYRLLAAMWGILRPFRPKLLRIYLTIRRKTNKRREKR